MTNDSIVILLLAEYLPYYPFVLQFELGEQFLIHAFILKLPTSRYQAKNKALQH